MTIAVTDATGYLGTHMLLCLQDVGERWVAITDKSAASLPPALTENAVAPLVRVNYANTLECVSVLKRYDVDTMIHFTNNGAVHRSFDRPEHDYQANTVGTLHLLNACVAARCVKQMVFSSSAAVYGIPERMPIRESVPLAPISPYGASIEMAERMVQDITKAHGVFSMILRYFNAAGADPQIRMGERGKSRHLIKKVAHLVARKLITGASPPPIQIYGDNYDTPDGTCVRDYVHITDIASAHYAAVAHLRAGGNSMVLNCGYGFGTSVKDVLSSVERVAGVDLPVQISARRAGDPPALIADNAAIRAELDWRPRFDELDFIIRTAIDWERKILCS